MYVRISIVNALLEGRGVSEVLSISGVKFQKKIVIKNPAVGIFGYSAVL